MELTIGKKLGLGFGTVLALAAISAGITCVEISRMLTSEVDLTEHAFPAESACKDLLNGLNHSTAALRGYVILGDDPKEAEFFKADRAKAWKNMEEALAKMNELYKTTADANEKRNLGLVQSNLEDLRKLQQDVEDIAQTDKNVPAVQMMLAEGAPKADKLLAAVTAIIDAEVLRDGQGRACALRISSRLDAGQKAHREKGAYLLRTNCEETDPVLLWKWYIQLTQAEAAFRTAKSDLGLRPIYHHKEDRVQAHILVCFLALALWRTLEQWMQQKGLGSCARQLVKQIAGIKSVDVVVPVRRAGVATELRLRVVTTPEPVTAQLLTHLGLRLPKGTREISNVVPKITR